MKCSSPVCNGGIGRRAAGVKCCTSDPQPMRSGRQLYARHATWRKVGRHVRDAIDSHPAKTPREPFSWKPRIEMEGVSATSAGAMKAVVMAHGLTNGAGQRAHARR